MCPKEIFQSEMVQRLERKLEAETLEVYTIGLLQARAFVAPSWDGEKTRDWDGIFKQITIRNTDVTSEQLALNLVHRVQEAVPRDLTQGVSDLPTAL